MGIFILIMQFVGGLYGPIEVNVSDHVRVEGETSPGKYKAQVVYHTSF